MPSRELRLSGNLLWPIFIHSWLLQLHLGEHFASEFMHEISFDYSLLTSLKEKYNFCVISFELWNAEELHSNSTSRSSENFHFNTQISPKLLRFGNIIELRITRSRECALDYKRPYFQLEKYL